MFTSQSQIDVPQLWGCRSFQGMRQEVTGPFLSRVGFKFFSHICILMIISLDPLLSLFFLSTPSPSFQLPFYLRSSESSSLSNSQDQDPNQNTKDSLCQRTLLHGVRYMPLLSCLTLWSMSKSTFNNLKPQIVSHNEQGLNSPVKRRKLFQHYHSLKTDS